MSSVKDHLSKMREERLAREKARIEKLRGLNLKKYGKADINTTNSKLSSSSFISKNDLKVTSSNGVSKNIKPTVNSVSKTGISFLKTDIKQPVNIVSKLDAKKPVNNVSKFDTKLPSAKSVSKIDALISSANVVSKVDTEVSSADRVSKMDAALTSDGVSNIDTEVSSANGVPKIDTDLSSADGVPKIDTEVSSAYAVSNIDTEISSADKNSNIEAALSSYKTVSKIDTNHVTLTVNGVSKVDSKPSIFNGASNRISKRYSHSSNFVSKTKNTKLVSANGVSKIAPLNVSSKIDTRPACNNTKDKISSTLKTDLHTYKTTKRPSMVPSMNQRKSIAFGSTAIAQKYATKNNEKSNLQNNESTKPHNVVTTHNNTRHTMFNIEKVSEKSVKDHNLNRKSVIGFTMGKTEQKDFKDLIANNKKDVVLNQKKDFVSSNKIIVKKNKSQLLVRQSMAPNLETSKSVTKGLDSRKSIQPTQRTENTSVNPKRQTVFERLYQPKIPTEKKLISDSQKLLNDPTFLDKAIKNSGLILGTGDFCNSKDVSVRRSISAVHFRKVSKSQMNNCVQRWSSIGEKLDKAHLEDIDEDDAVREDKIVSAVKSECKKVKFQTPVSNFNTPKPDELQEKLQSWLKKRGKSIDSFQHLQCFGIQHLTREFKPLNLPKVKSVELTPLNLNSEKFEHMITANKETEQEFERLNLNSDKFELLNSNSEKNVLLDQNSAKLDEMVPLNIETEHFEDCLEDEDKENHPLESDSDNDSYNEMMNNKTKGDEKISDGNQKNNAAHTWRRASGISDSVTDLNESQDTTLTCTDSPLTTDDLAMGALNDLTKLLREGYSWEQCARWLRAIRTAVPALANTAAYWECRAELEARRGDLPASVHCWERACAQGIEPSVVEANLDQLLDKFMQLKISPTGGPSKHPDPKLVDVKNVFKSTLIRFAVQQAKIRESRELQFTVTPVRRSGRLSAAWSGRKGFRPPLTELSSASKGSRTPLLECATLKEAEPLHPIFVPNDTLCQTP